MSTKQILGQARDTTDQSIASLLTWPSTDDDGNQMLKSTHLFTAMLRGHRAAVKPGLYFWDEIQFYSDIIDAILGWLNGEIVGGRVGVYRHPLPGLIQSYSYLMGAIAYIGAEQALCDVFSAIVCFSHRETFYFANYSFAGEAVFRLYRQSYAGSHANPAGWRNGVHRSFFPDLHYCRREILAGMDYIGMSSDPSLCSHARKNETRIRDVESLSVHELLRLERDVEVALRAAIDTAFIQLTVSFAVLSSTVAYACAVFTPYVAKLTCDRRHSPKAHSPKQGTRSKTKLDENYDNFNNYARTSDCNVSVSSREYVTFKDVQRSRHLNDVNGIDVQKQIENHDVTDTKRCDMSLLKQDDCQGGTNFNSSDIMRSASMQVASV